MHVVKPIIYTILYIIFIELIGAWLFIADYFEADFLIDYYGLINGSIMALGLIIFTFFTNKRNFNLPQPTSYYWYILSIIVGFLYVFIQTPLNWIYNFISGDNYQILYDFNGFENFTNINILSTILLIPIAEELFFREFLQKNLQKRTHVYLAIGLISVLFASLHLPYENLFFTNRPFSFHHAYIALFGGIILGIVYYRSNSIGPTIVLHVLWNVMVVIV